MKKLILAIFAITFSLSMFAQEVESKELTHEIKRVKNEVWYIHTVQLDKKTCDSLNNCTLHREFIYPVDVYMVEDTSTMVADIGLEYLFKNGYLFLENIDLSQICTRGGFTIQRSLVTKNLVVDKKKKIIEVKILNSVDTRTNIENTGLIFMVLIYTFLTFFMFRNKEEKIITKMPILSISFMFAIIQFVIFFLHIPSKSSIWPSEIYLSFGLVFIFLVFSVLVFFTENPNFFELGKKKRYLYYPIGIIVYSSASLIYTSGESLNWVLILFALGWIGYGFDLNKNEKI